jgi:hypothetical protein
MAEFNLSVGSQVLVQGEIPVSQVIASAPDAHKPALTELSGKLEATGFNITQIEQILALVLALLQQFYPTPAPTPTPAP